MEKLNIPKSFKEAGIDEEEFLSKIDMLADRAFEEEIIVRRNIELCKQEWDAFETSWDFVKHPFVINSLLAFGEGFEKKHSISISMSKLSEIRTIRDFISIIK